MEKDDIGELEVDPMDDINFGLILPDTQRVRDKQAKALQYRMDYEKRKEELKMLKQNEERQRAKKKFEKEQQERMERKRLEEERRTKNDARAQIEAGTGNLMELFQTIYRNTSPFELAFANYNMAGSHEFNLLMTIMEENTSVLTLSLSRKGLGDNEGKKLAEMLKKNKKLRRLELEGNFLGPDSCKSFGEALKTNVTLRYLDLENNNLTNYGTDNKGLEELFKGLKINKMLISLNLSNNFLNEESGQLLEDLLRTNKILIHLEFFQNKNFTVLSADKAYDDVSKFKPAGLLYTQIQKIKEYLKENNAAYTKMRTDEWKERKGMTANYEDTEDTKMILETNHLQKDTREKEQKYIEELYLVNFNEHVASMEKEFDDAVNKYFAETKERLTKKKRKKGKKKK